MYTYREYEKQREAALKKARMAGIKNPGRRWPKLSRARLENLGEPANYWDQVAAMREAAELAREGQSK